MTDPERIAVWLSKADAIELHNYLEAAANEWEETEGWRVPWVDQCGEAIDVALFPPDAPQSLPQIVVTGEIVMTSDVQRVIDAARAYMEYLASDQARELAKRLTAEADALDARMVIDA